MAAPISITEGAAAAFGFLGRSWPRAAGAQALTALLSMTTVIALASRDVVRARPLILAGLVAALMARGALFRIARAERAGEGAPGFAGFQWGRLEWRLLGVTVLRGLLFGLLAALFLTVLAAVYVGAAAGEAKPGFAVAADAHWRPVLDPLGWALVSGVGLGGVMGLAWVSLRLYLAFAATAGGQRVQLLSTWPMTRGRVWRMLAAMILVSSPMLVVVLLARIVRGWLWLGGWGGARLATGAFGLILGLGHAFLVLPLSVGLMTYLYDRLGPEDAGVS